MSAGRAGSRRKVALVAAFTTLLTTMVLTPPAFADDGDPTDVTARAAGLNVAVTWAADGGADVTGYAVSTSPASPEVVVPTGTTTTVLTGLRPNVDYRVFVAALHAGSPGNAAAATSDVRTAAPGGSFQSLAPRRLLNTATGVGARRGPTTSASFTVLGRGGVPATGATAVVLNLRTGRAGKAGRVTVYPAGVKKPVTSDLQLTKGRSRSGLVIARIGRGGRVSVASTSKIQLAADVTGYFTTKVEASPSAGLYRPVQAVRVMDTRRGFGASTPGPAGRVKVGVTALPGVPSENVSAVVLATTAVRPTAAGSITAYQSGAATPAYPSLTFAKGETVTNKAVVPVGDDGTVSFLNAKGRTPLVVDVVGWFTSGADATQSGSYYVPLRRPTRIVDTATGLGGAKKPLGAKRTIVRTVAGRAGLPAATKATPTIAAAATVTFLKTSKATTGTVYASASARPGSFDLATPRKGSASALALPHLGTNGGLAIYSSAASTRVLVDVAGYFVGDVHRPATTVVKSRGEIVSVSGATGSSPVVTLDAGEPAAAVGQIVTSTVTPATPNGLLVKVVGVSTANGRQVLTTVPATLQEALGSADIAVSVPMTSADVVKARGPAARAVPPGQQSRRSRPLGSRSVGSDPVSSKKTTSPCSAAAGSSVTTEFSVNPTLNFEAHVGLSWSGPTADVKAYAQVEQTASAAFESGGKAGCDINRLLASYRFRPITFSVAGVPVVIVPELSVKLLANLSGTAKLSSSVTQHFVARAGLEYDDGSVHPINTVDNSLTYQPLALTEANGSASAALQAEVVGRFYGLAGPTITVTAKLSAKVDLLAERWWKLVFDVTGHAGLRLDVSVVHISAETDDFTLFHKVLAQAGGNPKPAAAVTLRFDDLPRYTSVTTAYRSYGVDFLDPAPYVTTDSAQPGSPVLSGGSGFGSPLTGAFVNPDGSARTVGSFRLDLGYIDEPGSTEVLAFDKDGRLLQTVTANYLGVGTVRLERSGIRFFTVRSTGVESSGWSIDNLAFKGFSGAVGQGAARARLQARSTEPSTRAHR